MPQPVTHRAAIDSAVQRLRATLGEEARFEAELLLAAALGVNRAMLVARLREPLDSTAQELFESHVARRAAGEPFAYITGRRGFWTLELAVTPDVLVPRPETELLVERVLAAGDACNHEAVSILDLGTGSGAIALAVASARPGWRVSASDISPAALEVARGNAIRLGIENVEFLEGEWWAPFPGRRFNVVASNPPYVAEDDPAMRDAALRHEPRIALTPGDDALAALRTIVLGGAAHLEAEGWLLLEHGAGQAPAVAQLLAAHGFDQIASHADLAGHLRVTEGRRAKMPE